MNVSDRNFKFETGKIYSTTNFSMFKFSPRNRPVSGKKVLDSIKEKNMLYASPILVTKDLIVLDGQHRLKAAEELNLRIYFIVCPEEITEDDIARFNVQQSFQLYNYINYNAKVGNDYSFLQYLIEKYPFRYYLSFLIDAIGSVGHSNRSFKEGKFKLKESKTVTEERVRELNECKETLATIFDDDRIIHAGCLQALWRLIKSNGYDHRVFIDKIKKDYYRDQFYNALKFRKSTNIYDCFVNIYNKRNTTKLAA